ncbi:MAG TPA: hypothetical protein PLJ60_21335 [Chryseolinea sp.]|nr:hypothetical protein [Chryseolinea sp.]HPH47162.1 hypothetical protein [Chryseolinea sp.]HPM32891.1 hypothetical protein [Chryseolinea sp.]
MDSIRLDGHKKVLGILYIISAMFTILGMIMLNAILSVVFSFVFNEIDPEQQKIMELVLSIVQYVPAFVIILFSIPTLIAGIGLLTRQTWSTLFALIMGCLKLFNFPIGTAIGIYAIWIYSEDQRLKNAAEVK